MVKKLDFYYKIDINEILFKNSNEESKLIKGEDIFIKENHYPLSFEIFTKIFLEHILNREYEDFELYLKYEGLNFKILEMKLRFYDKIIYDKKVYDILPLDIKEFFYKVTSYFEQSDEKQREKWKTILLNDSILEEFCKLIKKYEFNLKHASTNINLYEDFIDAFEKLRYDSNYKKEFQNQSIKKEFE